jgi:hypothetical protein
MPHDPLAGALAAACSGAPTPVRPQTLNAEICRALGFEGQRLVSLTLVLQVGELPLVVTRRHMEGRDAAGQLRLVVERHRLAPAAPQPVPMLVGGVSRRAL